MRLWYWRPPCLLRTVLISLKSPADEGVRGVLFESRGPFYVLKHPTAIKAGHPPEDLDGDVIIDRHNVAFIKIDEP